MKKIRTYELSVNELISIIHNRFYSGNSKEIISATFFNEKGETINIVEARFVIESECELNLQ